MNFETLVKEAQKELLPDGARKTCMIQGKYSKEFTDYYLNQLAEFFGFDFFQNKKDDIVSKLEPNQKFKSMREVIEDLDDPILLDSMLFITKFSHKETKHCEDKEESKKRFEDMMFFDGLIMNNKRNIDNFGFIIDTNDEHKYYKFVCFYDEYNSIFDHLNGINEENYYNVIKSLSSWIDNDIRRQFILSTMSEYVQQRHTEKMLEFLNSNETWQFKDNELFQIDETKNIEYEELKLSIYEFHIQRSFSILPELLQKSLKIKELYEDSIKLEEFMTKMSEQEKNITYTQEELTQRKFQNLEAFISRLRHDAKINPRKLEKTSENEFSSVSASHRAPRNLVRRH